MSYTDSRLSKVVVEYLSGTKVIVAIEKWNLLDLEINFQKIARRHKHEELQQ